MDYLHYWFTHYDGGGKSLDVTEINRLKRVELIERQISALNQRNAAITNGAGTDEFGKMIDYLTTQQGNMKSIYEGTASGSSADVTIAGTSISSLGSMGLSNISSKIAASAEELSYLLFEFQYTLTDVLESAYKQLNSDIPFTEFQNRLVQAYAENKQLPTSEVGKSIIQDFLKTNGLKGLPKTSTSLEAYLQRLALLAYAIPSYGGESYNFSTGSRSGTVSSVPEFFKIIASKTSGTLNFVRKEAGELAVMKAEADVVADFVKQLQDVNTQIHQTSRKMVSNNGNGWLSADVTVKSNFDNVSTDKSKSNMRLSRGDVEVNVNNSTVSVTYGINVKDQNINRQSKYQNINLVRNMPFVNAYRTVFSGYGNNMDFLYQLAAGHEGGEYSDSVLSLYWNEMIDTVVKGSMLDALAGLPQENVIYLSLNGQMFSIADIAQRILNSEVGGNLAGGADLSYSTLGLNRENSVAVNRWIGSPTKNTVYALQRSEAVLPQIQAYLNRAKITIDLKLLTTLIRS